MPQNIQRAAVIGAGNMGAGIAAHLANAGVPVLLLDRANTDGGPRNAPADKAVARQLASGGFMHPRCAELVSTGNIDDDLGHIAEADWIVEAVFEDLEVKRALYRLIDAARKPGSIVSSNTSTIPLSQLTEGLGAAFERDAVITHFFNPPRAMKLLELVGGRRTGAEVLARAAAACDQVLGKTVIRCRDTPGFIANRIGNYWMSVAVLEAMALGLTVEQADAVMGVPFGMPRTGIFGLFDYVGVNLVPLVWGSFMQTLATDDAHRRHDITRDVFISRMLARGQSGRQAGAGFYRNLEVDGRRSREALDLKTGDYRPLQPVQLDSLDLAGGDLRALCGCDDAAGRYAWRVLSHVVAYSADVAPEIADSVTDIDTAMRLGYNWSLGPFELADRVGLDLLAERLQAEGRAVPPLLAQAQARGGFYVDGLGLRPTAAAPAAETEPAPLSYAGLRRHQTRVGGHAAASLWDLGQGVLGVELHTKMNACNDGVVAVLESVPAQVAAGFRAVVIGNDHPRAFSVGADLASFVALARAQDWAGLTRFVERGQSALQALQEAPFPVVGAPFGLTLGGGCELQMACHASVAHADLAAGQPELKVGILPGWGGCTRLLERWAERRGGDALAGAMRAFTVITEGATSASAMAAVDMALLRPTDRIVFNRDRLLQQARDVAVAMTADHQPPTAPTWRVPGSAGADELMATLNEAFGLRAISQHDLVVARAIAAVLTGGSAAPGTRLTARDILRLEVQHMVELARMPASLARMEHMLATGKPLHN